jgi:basic amino acid/polyamine antiporter, APA family
MDQFFIVVITILLIVSHFILRRREPETPRPFRAWGYPFAPLLVLVVALMLFFGYMVSNPYPSLYAVGLLVISYALFRLLKTTQI